MNKRKSVKESPLRQLPSVDKLISAERAEVLIGDYGRYAVVEAARTVLKELRLKMKKNERKPNSKKGALTRGHFGKNKRTPSGENVSFPD